MFVCLYHNDQAKFLVMSHHYMAINPFLILILISEENKQAHFSASNGKEVNSLFLAGLPKFKKLHMHHVLILV